MRTDDPTEQSPSRPGSALPTTLDSSLAEVRVRMAVMLGRTQMLRRRLEAGLDLDRAACVATLYDVERNVWAMEASLREGETRFRTILGEATDYAILTTDAEGRIDGWYPGAEAVFGWPADEALGQSVAITFTPEDRARGAWRQELELARRTGRAPDVRWHARRDGERVFIEGAAYAVRDPDGPFVGLLKIGQDVTGRRASEEALRSSEEWLRALAIASSEALYRMSADWSEMINLKGMDFIADTERSRTDWMDHYIPPDEQPRVAAAIRAAIDAKAIFELEHRVYRPDGTEAWTFSRAVPILDADGAIRHWFGVASDITGRRHAEEALRRSEASAQRRVTEATAELRALSRRLLLVQEEERRHLSRELHDEIGQTLTSLAILLRPGTDTMDRLPAARAVVRELTNQVRQLSTELRPAVLDSHGLLPALGWHIERYQDRTGIRVDLRHEGVEGRLPPDVEVTAYRVVQEALTNVARHARTREATVLMLAAGGVLTVSIQDAGAGFDAGAMPAAGGLGGMRERVELVGGTLAVDTGIGAGTVITAELPLDETGGATLTPEEDR